jgi:hypothetical protein
MIGNIHSLTARKLCVWGHYCTFFIVVQELDIIELEKRYWYLKSGTKTGKFDLETFMPLVSSCVSETLAKGMLFMVLILTIL